MFRVLHVVGSMTQGGTENFLMNMYRNIDKKKIQFDFLVNRDGCFDNEILSYGGKIYKIKALQKTGILVYKHNLDHFFKEHQNEYLIIHSHINKVSGVILERAKKANIPVRISHSHGSAPSTNYFVRTYKEYLGKKILYNATHMFACSNEAAVYLYGKDFAPQATIIENGIDYKKFGFSSKSRDAVRDKFGIDKDTFVIGNVASFKYEKNHNFIIDIFNEYVKINSNSCLLLVGDGKLRKEIELKVAKLNLQEKVIFAGIQINSNEFYSSFDCFLFPSFNEGLPLSVIEAQVSGLPVLTTMGGVSYESKICENIKFLKLSSPAVEWSHNIIKNNERINFNIEKRFDVNLSSKKLCSIYINSLQKEKTC